MKKFIFIPFLALLSFTASAQYYQDSGNPDILRHNAYQGISRVEFVLPQVLGYNVYKADLHTHTFYSDGSVAPDFRVSEAWYDGLDVIAITDHIEWRPHEPRMIAFLENQDGKGTEAVNYNIIRKDATKERILSDLNHPVKLAQVEAVNYGITIIPGTEITREPKTIGHYNALFTKDNNTIYDVDPYKSIKNAKEQGALIMHNHPGWRRENLDISEFEQKVYDDGLIDGIEIMNGDEFYPRAIDRALKYNFFMSSNTDIHDSSAEYYRLEGNRRNMTFILAKDASLESIREALEAKRTLAYSFGTVAGPEDLLKALFEASVEVKPISGDRFSLTNNTSLAFILKRENSNPVVLKPFSSIRLSSKSKKVKYTVENFWVSSEKKLEVEIKL